MFSDVQFSVKKKRSFLRRLSSSTAAESTTMIVHMPRGEYLKYFAKNESGQYVGTEPQQIWTAAELKDRYGKYER